MSTPQGTETDACPPNVDLIHVQQGLAVASEDPEKFGEDYFAEVLRKQDDPICKWYAIRALGHLKTQRHHDLLLDVLRDEDVPVGESSLHRICASSIGRIGRDLVPSIIDMLKQATEPEVQLAMIDALGEIGDPLAIPELAACLEKGDDKSQLWAALSLGKIGEESIPALRQILPGATPRQAVLIVDALAMIEVETTLDVVGEAIEKHPDEIRSYFVSDVSEQASSYTDRLRDIASRPGGHKGGGLRF